MKRRNSIKLALHRGAARAVVVGPLTFLLVAGAGCPTLFESTTHRAAAVKQAVPGNDGVKTVNAADTNVNAYVALAANAAAGAQSITVANIGDLTTNFSRALARGDLLLIIQMQGATINTTDTVNYGSIASEADLGSAGRYEFVGVEGVTTASNQITLACALKNAYSAAGKTQVIRVPQYTTLTITGTGSISAPTWNGATGGIVAVHAQTTVQLDGNIDVSAKGFRGGTTHDSTGNTGVASSYAANTAASGADKGESIAGYQAGYGGGRYGRGAPANGGGGGDPHNGGGGGGANAGVIASWTGAGVMTACLSGTPASSATAWTRDPAYTASTCANSEGGGRGGYSWSSADQDATTVGPGTASWGGDSRRNTGGLGGRPLASSPGTRLYMGGGGGAGDGNNGVAGKGGVGGGMVFLIAGSVAGSGTIFANGEAGANDGNNGGVGGDAAGGGGGGGTVIVNASTIAATVKIRANGGAGGQHLYSVDQNEVEGPGGGGGGGYVAVAGGSPDRQANGGLSGTTNRTAMSEFQENGATAGHAGITTGDASSFLYCGGTLTTTIDTRPANPTNDTTGDFTFTNTSSPVTYQCKLDTADWAACTTSYTTGVLTEGTHTLSVRATDGFGNVEADPPTYTWVVDLTPPDTSIATRPDNPSTDPTGEFTFGSTETAVTFQCKLDSAATFTACPASYTTDALANGEHTLAVRAVDAAGNVDASPATYTWTVAVTGPVTTLATHPTNPSNDATGDFTFTNTRSPVTYQCKLDGPTATDLGAWGACSAAAGHTTATLVDGTYTLSVRSTYAGEVESPVVTYTWVIDTVAPDTAIATKPSDPSGSPVGVFTFTSPETPVTFECSLDGGAWTVCGASYSTPFLPNGLHTLSVRAVDAATNVDGTPATYIWDIEAVGLDSGVLDASATEAGGIDSGPVVIDAEAIDSERRDLPLRDVPADTRPVILDVAGSEPRAEVPPILAEAGGETYTAPEVSGDTRPGAEPGPDSAVVTGPEPSPDTAPPVTHDDAAVAQNDDAAALEPNIKVLGGGFCAISSTRTVSPAGLALLALAGLTLLRRRRRR